MNPLKITRGQYYVPRYSHVWPQLPRPPSALWLSAEKLCRCSNGTVGAGGAGRTGWEFADLLKPHQTAICFMGNSIINHQTCFFGLVVDKPMYKKFKSYKYNIIIYIYAYIQYIFIYIHIHFIYMYIHIFYYNIHIHTHTRRSAAVRQYRPSCQAPFINQQGNLLVSAGWKL